MGFKLEDISKDINNFMILSGQYVKYNERFYILKKDDYYFTINRFNFYYNKYLRLLEDSNDNYLKIYNGGSFPYMGSYYVGFKNEDDGKKLIEQLESWEVMERLTE